MGAAAAARPLRRISSYVGGSSHLHLPPTLRLQIADPPPPFTSPTSSYLSFAPTSYFLIFIFFYTFLFKPPSKLTANTTINKFLTIIKMLENIFVRIISRKSIMDIKSVELLGLLIKSFSKFHKIW